MLGLWCRNRGGGRVGGCRYLVRAVRKARRRGKRPCKCPLTPTWLKILSPPHLVHIARHAPHAHAPDAHALDAPHAPHAPTRPTRTHTAHTHLASTSTGVGSGSSTERSGPSACTRRSEAAAGPDASSVPSSRDNESRDRASTAATCVDVCRDGPRLFKTVLECVCICACVCMCACRSSFSR